MKVTPYSPLFSSFYLAEPTDRDFSAGRVDEAPGKLQELENKCDMRIVAAEAGLKRAHKVLEYANRDKEIKVEMEKKEQRRRAMRLVILKGVMREKGELVGEEEKEKQRGRI